MYTNFNSSFISQTVTLARKAWTTQRDQKADLSNYWARFDNIDHLLDHDDSSDSDIDYNSDHDYQEDDVEMLEEVQQKPSQAPKNTEQAKQVPSLN